ncbi:MAG: carbohydrate kinase family protein [Chloroflexota bacterium]
MAPASARDIDLLVVGEINPDVVVTDADPRPAFGQAERIVESIRLVIGSSSCIAACGAARLGLRVAMVGVVGDDALGRFMLEALVGRGVDVSACRVASARPTGASVILGNSRDRAILTSTGTIADTRASDVPAELLARARHVHVGSFYLQPDLAAEVPSLFRAAHAAGATTASTPTGIPTSAGTAGSGPPQPKPTSSCPTKPRHGASTGLDDVAAAARELRATGMPAPPPWPELGAAGGLAVGPDGSVGRAHSPVVDVVDTTGAGDSFDAGSSPRPCSGGRCPRRWRWRSPAAPLHARAAHRRPGDARRGPCSRSRRFALSCRRRRAIRGGEVRWLSLAAITLGPRDRPCRLRSGLIARGN